MPAGIPSRRTALPWPRRGLLYTGLGGLSLGLALLWQNAFALPASRPQGLVVMFYQHVTGRLDGRPCPSYPVCSAYARQAIDKHGLLLGSWLALDRLIHENDDLALGPWRIFEGQKRLYDPLSRNDFWLDAPGEKN
jgi:hypothetical protein